MARVELEAVHKAYAPLPPVIRDVNLQLADAEFCAFVGPSGCGKSTLLRLVAGLDTLSSGALHLFDAQDQALPRTGEATHWPMPVVA